MLEKYDEILHVSFDTGHSSYMFPNIPEESAASILMHERSQFCFQQTVFKRGLIIDITLKNNLTEFSNMLRQIKGTAMGHGS